MSVIPCKQDEDLSNLVDDYADALKSHAHTLGQHGLSEEQFYRAGIFRGAIERIRGQFSADSSGKREFVRDILNYMQDRAFIAEWEPAAGDHRHEYVVRLPSGKTSVIELKGCLDGNNTKIFVRPSYADEFVIWSLCQNAAADPRLNVWSGLHTRLSSEMLTRRQQIDGVVVWDMVCGTVGRPCPKLTEGGSRLTRVAHFTVPPTCIYVLPKSLPELPASPTSFAQTLAEVELLNALHVCFGGKDSEVNYVDLDIEQQTGNLKRRTTVRRDGAVVKKSKLTLIRRA